MEPTTTPLTLEAVEHINWMTQRIYGKSATTVVVAFDLVPSAMAVVNSAPAHAVIDGNQIKLQALYTVVIDENLPAGHWAVTASK
jgi:phenylpyruvate tautomerase PptA (4-oxalocrotonate tautomerase family)